MKGIVRLINEDEIQIKIHTYISRDDYRKKIDDWTRELGSRYGQLQLSFIPFMRYSRRRKDGMNFKPLRTKLTDIENQKKEMISLYKTGGYTLEKLAKKYSVCTATVFRRIND